MLWPLNALPEHPGPTDLSPGNLRGSPNPRPQPTLSRLRERPLQPDLGLLRSLLGTPPTSETPAAWISCPGSPVPLPAPHGHPAAAPRVAGALWVSSGEVTNSPGPWSASAPPPQAFPLQRPRLPEPSWLLFGGPWACCGSARRCHAPAFTGTGDQVVASGTPLPPAGPEHHSVHTRPATQPKAAPVLILGDKPMPLGPGGPTAHVCRLLT